MIAFAYPHDRWVNPSGHKNQTSAFLWSFIYYTACIYCPYTALYILLIINYLSDLFHGGMTFDIYIKIMVKTHNQINFPPSLCVSKLSFSSKPDADIVCWLVEYYF